MGSSDYALTQDPIYGTVRVFIRAIVIEPKIGNRAREVGVCQFGLHMLMLTGRKESVIYFNVEFFR